MAKEVGAENRWHSLDAGISVPAFSVIRKAWLVPIVEGMMEWKQKHPHVKGKETIKGCNSLVTGKLDSQLQCSEIVGLETKVFKCFSDENIMHDFYAE